MLDVASSVSRGARSMRFVQKIYLTAIILVIACFSFVTTFLGYWSPQDILGKIEVSQVNTTYPSVEIVTLPKLAILLPSPELKTLIIAISLDVAPGVRGHVEHLMPRLLDAFRSFISDIEPLTFEKIGILDAIREELSIRATYILGVNVVQDVLITEFLME